jgi:hypothetical protein
MDKYRVIVMRESSAEDETLFEIAGSASLVQNVVPGVLDAVLSGSEEVRSLADRVFDSATAAGREAERQGEAPETEEAKTKRNRRTKAQIAADKEAQGLGFRDAAHRAEAESQQQVHPGGPDPAAVPAEVPSGFAPVPPAVPAPSVATGDPAPAAPYNPFATS